MMQVTVTLPDEVYKRAERLADATGRDVADILAAMLEISLPIQPLPLTSQPIESLPDDAILMLADSRMDAQQNARMSSLLDKQQAMGLDEAEQHELSLFMHVYQEGSLRKARALVEAGRRGLKASPAS